MIRSIVLFALVILRALTVTSQDCPKLTIKDFPKKDLPPQGFNAKDRESTDYYYGLGVPVNYDTARYLAFKEMAPGEAGPLSGEGILLNLYANGYGVTRDLDLSIRLACGNVGFAEAEKEGRREHLEKMRANSGRDTFDICDDITSGYMMGFCTSIITSRSYYERKAALTKVLSKWPPKDTIAFAVLQKAATAFFDLASDREVDQSGTARGMEVQFAFDDLENSFFNKIASLDKCSTRLYSPSDFARADKELNVVYEKVMTNESSEYSTITAEGIKETQRSWLKYRDAWVNFGKIKCPRIPSESWLTLLTNERVEQLKVFLPE